MTDKILGVKILVDATSAGPATAQAEASFDKVTGAAQRMGTTAATALNQVETAQGRLTAAVAPATAAVDSADRQVQKLGVSAAQTAAAMRMVPAQFTDIAVSLASGQSPFTVLMQQGGQLKDSFGGIGAAARGLGTYVAGLVSPLSLGAAAAGAFAVAAYQGSQESRAYSQALILNGNAAGTTASALAASSAEISRSVGTQGAAAAALVEIAGSGKIAAADIEAVGTAALKMREATGKAVGDSVKEFEKLADAPVKASVALNEQYHYLTESVYKQIAALEKQGDKDAAASLAQRTYAQAMSERASEVQANLGYMERGWNSVTNAAKRAWDAMVNAGRADTLQDVRSKIEQTQNKLNALLTQGDGFATTGGGAAVGGGGRGTAAAIARLREELAALHGQAAPLEAADSAALVKSEQQRTEDAKIAAHDRLEAQAKAMRSRTQLRADEIKKLDADYAILGERDERYNQLLAAINEKYADPKRKGTGAAAGGENEVARLRAVAIERERELAALQARDTATTKLTQSEREVLKLTEELKTSISGKARAMKEAALVEAQRGAAAERQIETLKAQEKLERELAEQRAKTEEAGWKAADSTRQQADAQEAANATFGLGKSAMAELTLEQQRKSLADLEATDRVIPGYVAALRQQIAEQERLVAALRSGEGLDAQKKAADQQIKDQERAAEATERRWEQVSQSLADDLMRGGKTAGEYLQGYFRTLVLRPAIQAGFSAVGNALGISGLSGTGDAKGGIDLMSVGSNLSTAYNLYTGKTAAFANNLYNGATSWYNGTGFMAGYNQTANATLALNSTAPEYGLYAAGQGTAPGALSTLGTAATVAAVAALVLNVAGAFRSERVSDVGFTGTLARGATELDAFKEWRTGGSLVTGPEYNRRFSDMDVAQQAALSKGVDAIYASVAAQLAALGESADGIDAYTQRIDLSTQGLSSEQAQAKVAAELQRLGDGLADTALGQVEQAFTHLTVSGRGLTERLESVVSGIVGMEGVTEDMQAGLAGFAAIYGQQRQLTAEQTAALRTQLDALSAVLPAGNLFAGTIDEIRQSIENSGTTGTRMVSVLTQYAKEGESTSVTLSRLAGSLTAFNAVASSVHLAVMGLSLESGNAASKFVEAAGGLDQLKSLASGYYEAIFTDAEKADDRAKRVLALIGAAGFDGRVAQTGEAMRAEYKRITEAQSVYTDAGRSMRLQLLAGAGDFAAYVDALTESAAASRDATAAETGLATQRNAQLEAARRMQSAAQDTTAQALAGVERAVAAERASATAIFDARASAASSAIDAITQSVGKLSSASGKLRSVVDQFTTDQVLGLTRAEASGQLSAALVAARAGGTVDADKIGNALSVIARSGAGQYTSFIEYARDFDAQAAKVGELAKLTDAQLSVEERSLTVARDQLQAIEAARREQMTRLDGILESARAQVDAVNGNSTALLSVASALATLGTAISTQQIAKQAVVKAGGATNPAITGADIRDYVYNGADRTVSENAWYMDVYNKAVAEGVGSAQLADAMKGAGWTQQTILDWTASQGLKPFATGGAFTNGIVSRPTTFDLGLMGEAGPEAILPLANVGGRLGVRSLGGAMDVGAVVEELRGLRTDLAAALRDARLANSAENLGIAQSINRMEFILKKFDLTGMPPVRAAVGG